MNGAPGTAAAARSGVWPMYRAMVGIGLLCGLLIVGAFELTRPIIERNRAEALQLAIFRVLPDARSSRSFRLAGDDRFEPVTGQAVGAEMVHAGFDDHERLVGLAIEAQGIGYQDVIRVLYGYSYERDAIVGIFVLESKETPGLGTKIETDPAFLQNFAALDVALNDDGSALAHDVEFVKPGQKQHAWQIDGITGATISSAAVASIVSRSAAYWVPRVRRGRDDLQQAE